MKAKDPQSFASPTHVSEEVNSLNYAVDERRRVLPHHTSSNVRQFVRVKEHGAEANLSLY